MMGQNIKSRLEKVDFACFHIINGAYNINLLMLKHLSKYGTVLDNVLNIVMHVHGSHLINKRGRETTRLTAAAAED